MRKNLAVFVWMCTLFIGVFLVSYGLHLVYHAHLYQTRSAISKKDMTTVSPINQSMFHSKPVPISISIPKFHMNALILPVGLDREGRMATIPGAKTIAWYAYGAAPGQVGNAILAGHRDWDGVLGSFWGLENLKIGDFVHISLSNGTKITFKVTSDHTYPAQNVPPESMDLTGTERTTLITCVGDFVRDRGGYQSRVVVILQKTDGQSKG